jgi:hypothetical protein
MTSRVRGPYGTFATENHFSELARTINTAGGQVAATARRNAAVQNLTGDASAVAATLGSLSQTTTTLAELNKLDNSAMVMTKGAGITGTGVVYKSGVHWNGDLAWTRIFMDLTDLTAGGTLGDILGGVGGAASSNIGQVTAALNGTIIAGWIDVIETPGGGDTDIDLYAATLGTGSEDVAISGITGQAILVNSGAWSAGNRKILTAFPAADAFLYLVGIDGGNAAYTAGQFILTLVGTI